LIAGVAQVPFTPAQVPFTPAQVPFTPAQVPFTPAQVPFTPAQVPSTSPNRFKTSRSNPKCPLEPMSKQVDVRSERTETEEMLSFPFERTRATQTNQHCIMALRQKGEIRTVTKDLAVLNELGLHARPAAQFVRCVQRFRSEIWLISKGTRFHAGRLMDVLIANLDRGAVFTIEATGTDAEEAVEQLEQLMVHLRDEEEKGAQS
jgi:phosphocarrier protein HPr